MFISLIIAQVSQLLKPAEQFTQIPFQAVEIFICQLKPVDNDVDWPPNANQAIYHLLHRKILDGQIQISLSNTLWLGPIVKRTYLSSLKVFVHECQMII